MNVALHAPGWPRSLYANGVVTAVDLLVEPLRAAGVRTCVLAWEGKLRDSDRDVHLIPEAPPRAGVQRMSHGLLTQIDRERPNRQTAARRIHEALAAVQSSSRPDLLEIEEAFGLAAYLAGMSDTALVVTLHGPWFLHGPLQGELARERGFRDRVRIEGEALRKADLLIAPSSDVLERTRRFYSLQDVRAEVIPYAVPAKPPRERWRLAESDPDRVLFVGRFDGHKGGDLVLRALAQVAKVRPRAHLVFVGPDRSYEDHEGRRWSLEEYAGHCLPGSIEKGQVIWTGQLPAEEIEEHRLRARLTISCSRWENLSLAALEAMAAGCPLVVSDQGGLVEHVRDGQSGLVFSSGNADELAACIIRVLDQPALAEALGQNAARYVEGALSPARIARRRQLAYERAILARSAKGRPCRT